MRQLIAVTPDNPNRNAVETGSYTRWNNQAYGTVHRGTVIHGTDSNQEDIMNSNINLTWCHSMEGNSQPRQFVQQNRHNFRPPRNNENIQRQG
ncbi:hypothetical protein TNIN_419641 [Trichonephila inaurata madagascariensis]|uniref:Uncharacterized protein n=1 Tax=Trichonephila inaurata madagascariensis TaxID=2747483 RepID=A0A8X6Y688_9ARAC|nr:hypothetical protein TNIN_419641 [Trichonephila inaurata madagascariensis]